MVNSLMFSEKAMPSPGLLEMDPTLRSNLENSGVTCCSVEDIEPESIDYIYSINVLEHIPDDSVILATLYSKLRKGGRVLIYVPALIFCGPQWMMQLVMCGVTTKSKLSAK